MPKETILTMNGCGVCEDLKDNGMCKSEVCIAVGYGALATLKLGNIARSTIQARKLKKLRQISTMRGGPQGRSVSTNVQSNYLSTMSMA